MGGDLSFRCPIRGSSRYPSASDRAPTAGSGLGNCDWTRQRVAVAFQGWIIISNAICV